MNSFRAHLGNSNKEVNATAYQRGGGMQSGLILFKGGFFWLPMA